MKNLLKKLHIKHNQSGDLEGSTSSKSNKFSVVSSPERLSHSEHKPFSAISGWLNSVTNRGSPSPPRSSNVTRGERIEQSDSASSSTLEAELDAVLCDSGTSSLRDPDVDEEYQMQLALELSAREDPEAVQIETAKQISLVPSHLDNNGAEVVAYRYWNYNALGYDDMITDGFYDLYGISMEPTSSKMPSLFDLQSKPTSDNITWEAVLVNTVADSDLKHLQQKASEIAARSGSPTYASSGLVKQLAALVSDQMGGPVGDPDNMLRAWRSLSLDLRESLGSLVLPLGSVTVGLPRHRALLFKFLADSVGIPCRLVKGQQYTGSDDVAMNFVRVDDDREYIVDLMADPGTLIPSDIAGSHIEYEKSFFPTDLLAVDPTLVDSSSSGVNTSDQEVSEKLTLKDGPRSSNISASGRKSTERIELVSSVDMLLHDKAEGDNVSSATSPVEVKKDFSEFPCKPNSSHMLVKSPSWTEGVSSPAAYKMKVKDVSQYMIDAAKENPELAQRLHAVLLESGVVAPPDLFTEIHQKESNLETVAPKFPFEYSDRSREGEDFQETKGQGPQGDIDQTCLLPFLPYHDARSKEQQYKYSEEQPDVTDVQKLFAASQFDVAPSKLERNVPVASAAAAAAVVASSIVVAASRKSYDPNLELPVAAAVTAKAAVLVATTAALSNQYECRDSHSPGAVAPYFDPFAREHRVGDPEAHPDATVYEPQGCDYQVPDAVVGNLVAENTLDKSTRQEIIRTAALFDEVSDCEILWEDITLGQRIGFGSYGEVYRGDWHGTEVAVKKFLDQVITGESLKEFKSEVRIMKRARHPNVVLFMGAVTRAPNLSIVTEFLPRGSLYRLIHRPNNQLDVRRRMRMALDTARGMNYLHNCTPVVVHRDLKSPNLLVDKNWVVKVCDFGLSRLKYSTFLSSRSTAGTAEWMAPEVLRNEPSDEKSDVFSYGVILWELCTMQQPWGGLNPMQVVGAVGFQHRRLDIPEDIDPIIADIISKCWQTDPKLRPSFAEIMAALKPLITSQESRPPLTASSAQERSQPSHALEEK